MILFTLVYNFEHSANHNRHLVIILEVPYNNMQCFSGKVHNVQSVPLRLLLPKSHCSDPAWFTDNSMNITILPFEYRTGPIFRYQLWLWKYFLKNYITLLPFKYRTSPIFKYQLWLKYFLRNSEVCFHTIIFFGGGMGILVAFIMGTIDVTDWLVKTIEQDH